MSERFQLRPEVIPMLMKLASPISKEELLSIVKKETHENDEQMSALFDAIRSSGIVTREYGDAQSASYGHFYGQGLLNHRGMLSDHARTDGFRRALKQVVRDDDTVIDVGAGTGILGFFAAQAGARRVILIENTPAMADAKEVARANGLDDRIVFYAGNAESFDQDVEADVIVSEWVGYFLMTEYMFAAFTAVRDRCLAKGGVVVPSGGRLYLAPLEDPHLHLHVGFGLWEQPLYGFDFSIGSKRQRDRLQKVITEVRPESILAEPWEIMSVDCRTDQIDVFAFEQRGEFVVDRGGSVHGFAGWFELDLSPGVVLDTSPFSETTHWKHVYFPVQRFNVEKGDRIELTLTTARGGLAPDVTIRGKAIRDGRPVYDFDYKYAGRQF